MQSEVLPSVFQKPAAACLCLLTQCFPLFQSQCRGGRGLALGLSLREFQPAKGGYNSAPSVCQAVGKALLISHATDAFGGRPQPFRASVSTAVR